VALVGRPNSGKSSLLNTVLGQGLCVVTPVPQTTRRRLKGIYTAPGLQVVFVDTPGIHEGRHSFNEAMVRESRAALSDQGVDVAAYLVDLTRPYGSEEDAVAAMVAGGSVAPLLVFNKADLCPEAGPRVDEFLQRYPRLADARRVVLSAVRPEGAREFLKVLTPLLPVGPPLYPDDQLTDENLRFFAAEYLRGAIANQTREEIPHASFVEITGYRERSGRHDIDATIHVETRGQRGILIGRGGAMLTRVREAAEKEMTRLVGTPAWFHCHVKVSQGWRDNPSFLRSMGYQVDTKRTRG
jgi:GTP-binding protein Era